MYSQVGYGSKRWKESCPQEDAERVSKPGVQQKGVQGDQNALFLQTRKRTVGSRHPAAAAHRLLQGDVSIRSLFVCEPHDS